MSHNEPSAEVNSLMLLDATSRESLSAGIVIAGRLGLSLAKSSWACIQMAARRLTTFGGLCLAILGRLLMALRDKSLTMVKVSARKCLCSNLPKICGVILSISGSGVATANQQCSPENNPCHVMLVCTYTSCATVRNEHGTCMCKYSSALALASVSFCCSHLCCFACSLRQHVGL